VRRFILTGMLAAVLSLTLSGCAAWDDGPRYWWQSALGQLDLLRRARPVAELIADPATAPRLRARLELALQIRAFASRELGLPDNASYTRYADLGRPFVAWNVFAAPPLSLKLRQWCFPVVGCVSYHGFFSKDEAEQFARRMRDEGYESFVTGVPAYSTLGWFSDPLLNTFVNQPEAELARLIFHELAHQRFYLTGESTFNESFATTVERVGVDRWLAMREAATGDPWPRAAWQAISARRADFLALLKGHREALEQVFAAPLSDAQKRARRDAIFESMREDYGKLKQRWGGFAGYDRWFAQPLSTALLASVATYTALVPAFRALLDRNGGDLVRFYAAVERLARLPAPQRDSALAALANSDDSPAAR
jgi:predicted aminopeptidase